MKIIKNPMLIPFFFLLALLRCGAQTDSSSSVASLSENTNLKMKTASEIAILSGAGKGSSVYFPAGSLDSGTTVKIVATDSPSEFQNIEKSDGSNLQLSSASNPIQITAGGKSGVDLKTPMTINLPYSSTSLKLSSEISQTSDNLCAFLKAKDSSSQDQFYIWKKNSMQIDTVKKLAKFTSRKTGTYQLMYCGDLSIKNFKDAKEEGVAGLPPDQLSSKDSKMGFFSLSLNDTSYSHGLSQYCLLAGYQTASDNKTKISIVGNQSGKLKSSEKNILPLNLDLAKIAANVSAIYSIVFFQEEGKACPASFTTENRPQGKVSYYFKIDMSEISDGKQKKITFGQDGVSFTKKTVKIGLPSYSDLKKDTITKNKKICIRGETLIGTNENSSQVTSQLSLEMDTEGNLSGKSSWDFFVPNTVGEQTLNVSAEIGQECLPEQENDLFAKDPSTSAYELNLINPHSDGTYYLIPLSLSVTTSLPIGGQSCLQIYPGNYISSFKSETTPFKTLSSPTYLASWLMSLNTKYEVLLPWDESKASVNGHPYYDAKLFLSNCTSELKSKNDAHMTQSTYVLNL